MAVMLMTVSGSAYAQKSKFYSGDKSAREIKKSQQVYWDQIGNLEKKITKLQKERQRFVYQFESSRNSSLTDYYAEQISRNDSLISFYQFQADLLRQKCSEFTEYAASKDVQGYLDLRTRKTGDLTRAYVMVKYLERSGGYQTAQETVETEREKTDGLRGIVENRGYREVTVKITGPMNFYREFYLRPNQKSSVFILPCPGRYTATFSSGFENRTVTKEVGPNIVYHDNGNAYDFLATILK